MGRATGAAGTTAIGFLLVHDGAGGVRAVAWSPEATAVVHPQTVVLDQVYWTAGIDRPWLSVADNGTAVYVPGDSSNRQLVWVDRAGRIAPLAGEPAQVSHASVSPDGRRVAYGYATSLWVMDLDTGARTRLLSDVVTLADAWTPDSQALVVSSNMGGDWEIYTINISGHGELTPLLKKPFAQHPLDVAPDGTVIEFERHPETGGDLWTLRPDGTTSPLLVTKFNEVSARVSADGRYVAYVSDESGRNEVYAIPLFGKGDRVPISLGPGTGPVWSRDGRELFYRGGDDLISVDVRTAPTLVLGQRRKLLDLSAYDPAYFHEFDVSADGQRFLLIRTEPTSRPVRLNVMLNWVETLKTKLQAK
jgi:dipeptidyl aminopeptidase/acylaminoacyl peptidase